MEGKKENFVESAKKDLEEAKRGQAENVKVPHRKGEKREKERKNSVSIIYMY